MSNVHPLEVVGRFSETQLQVGENFNKLTGYGFTLTTLNYFLFKPWEHKGFFQFEVIIHIYLNTYFMGLRPLENILILSVWGANLDVGICLLQTSDSDV